MASVEPRRRPSGEPVSTPQILPTDRVTRGGGKRSRDDDVPTDQLIAIFGLETRLLVIPGPEQDTHTSQV